MVDITLRNVKGTPLTNQEIDNNFSNLNTGKIEVGNAVPTTGGTFTGSIGVGSTINLYPTQPPNASAATQFGMVFTNKVTSGSIIESTTAGDILSYAINVPQIGTSNSTYVGGIFRLDTRTTERVFAVFGYAATANAVAQQHMALKLDTGRVGFGLPNPLVHLHIKSQQPGFRIEDTNTGIEAQPRIEYYDSTGPLGSIGYSLSTSSDLFINNVANANIRFLTNDNTERMRITAAGNIGIGTTAPTEKLDVNGTAIIRGIAQIGGAANNSLRITKSGTTLIQQVGNGVGGTDAWQVSPWLSTTPYLHVASDGKVGIGLNTGLDGSLTTADFIQVRRNTDGWLLRHNRTDDSQQVGIQSVGHVGSVGLSIHTGGSEKVRIDNAGRVGIGTSSPSANLHARGSAFIGDLNSTARPASTSLGGTFFTFNFSGGNAENVLWNVFNNADMSFRFMQKTGDGTHNELFRLSSNLTQLYTGGTERLRIDSTGKVGIGTTAAVRNLAVGQANFGLDYSSSDGGSIRLMQDSSSNSLVGLQSIGTVELAADSNANGIGTMNFRVSNTERMRITAGGNVIIGGTAETASLGFAPRLRLEGSAPVIIFDRNNSGTPSDVIWEIAQSSSAGDLSLRSATRAGGSPAVAMAFQRSGRVGIGTTSPSGKLSIYENADAMAAPGLYAIDLQRTLDENGTGIGIAFGVSTVVTNIGAKIIHFRENTAGRGGLAFFTKDSSTTGDNAVERMRITSAGNVGIGTSAPTQKLQVDGVILGNNFRVPDTGGTFSGSRSVTGAALQLFDTAQRMSVFTNGTERLRIDSTGNLMIGQSSTSTPGIGNNTLGISLRGIGDSYFSRAGTGIFINRVDTDGAVMQFARQGTVVGSVQITTESLGITAVGFMPLSAGGSERMRITSAGNVGIGTSNPTAKLEVNGTFAAISKSFVIDHPTKKGMKLRYGSLEGPETGVYVRGRLKGNTIDLPDYWTGLVDEDSITVTLTPVGKHQKLFIESIENNQVTVGNDNWLGNIDCFYIVWGERKDIDKLIVEY
jgi:hypothetical protein